MEEVQTYYSKRRPARSLAYGPALQAFAAHSDQGVELGEHHDPRLVVRTGVSDDCPT